MEEGSLPSRPTSLYKLLLLMQYHQKDKPEIPNRDIRGVLIQPCYKNNDEVKYETA
jgi:hypothetical protein